MHPFQTKAVVYLVQSCASAVGINVKELLKQLCANFPRLRSKSVKRHSDVHELGGCRERAGPDVPQFVLPLLHEPKSYPGHQVRFMREEGLETIDDECRVQPWGLFHVLRDRVQESDRVRLRRQLLNHSE